MKHPETWMPHAAHFICGRSCAFHLATHVNGYIISTVGEYHPSTSRDARGDLRMAPGGGILARRDGEKPEEIGAGRLYETMVFRARKMEWAEVTKPEDRCCPYEIVSGDNIDFAPYNHPGDAYAGHLKLVKKYARVKWVTRGAAS